MVHIGNSNTNQWKIASDHFQPFGSRDLESKKQIFEPMNQQRIRPIPFNSANAKARSSRSSRRPWGHTDGLNSL